MGIFPHGLHGPGLCCIIGAKVTIPPQEDIMADYQEYRRRILHRRWRRMFITAALLILLVLLAAVGVLWKRLHREPAPNTAQGPTILQQELTGSEWNTISYTPARRLSVQTLDNGDGFPPRRPACQPCRRAEQLFGREFFGRQSDSGDAAVRHRPAQRVLLRL